MNRSCSDPYQAERGDTTWFGVVDGTGNAVSAIQSIFFEFGSGAALQRAVMAPRRLLGKTWGEDTADMRMEEGIDPSLVTAPRGAGHQIRLVLAFSQIMGHAGALVRDSSTLLEGAADPRSDGAVAAW